jgi:DNA repair protein RecN (Recombination protein N)
LEHVERLRQAAETAHAALIGQDDEAATSAIDLLGQAMAALSEGGRFDPALEAEAEALNAALAQAEESARTLRDYADGLEADPAALERAEERLIRIADLKRKYGETVIDVLGYAEDARKRLDELEHRAERTSELAIREQQLLEHVTQAAKGLSAQRQVAAHKLAKAAGRELHDLRLTESRFEVSVSGAQDDDGIPRDIVDFRIGGSADGEPRSMSRVASGGELARIALALKTILARAEPRPTLIFDEIDMGVGGRTAPVVGEKLWRVAAAGHQVLCVTHMPQVAAFADHHLVVSRGAAGETRVHVPDAGARLDELAVMLAGSLSDASRQSAQELLERAAIARQASRLA